MTVEAGQDKDTCLPKGEYDSEKFLGSLVELSVGLEVEIDIDEMSASKELYATLVAVLGSTKAFMSTWKTMPDEMMGVVPSSIRVPLLLANIIRSQYIGSEVSEDTMP